MNVRGEDKGEKKDSVLRKIVWLFHEKYIIVKMLIRKLLKKYLKAFQDNCACSIVLKVNL